MYISTDKDVVLNYYRRAFYYNHFYKKKTLCHNRFLFSVYMKFYEAITKNIGPIISEVYMENFCITVEEESTKINELLNLNCSSRNIARDKEIDCFVIELSGVFINDIVMESESNIAVMKKRLKEHSFSSRIANQIWINVKQNVNHIIDGQVFDKFFKNKKLFQLKFENSCKNIQDYLLSIELREYEKMIRDDQEALASVIKYTLEEIFEVYKDAVDNYLFKAVFSDEDGLYALKYKDTLKYKNFYLSFLLDDTNDKDIFINFTNAMKIGLRLQTIFLYFTNNKFKDTTVGRTQKATTKYKLKSLLKKDNLYKKSL